ncbi:MAG: hypothetical protein LBD58_08275 [Treponema sp.]|jgi:hypothetical protein|nr:hypothetical protein [Treponema sp.]
MATARVRMKEFAMPGTSGSYTIVKRKDTKKFLLTFNSSCGAPASVRGIHRSGLSVFARNEEEKNS